MSDLTWEDVPGLLSSQAANGHFTSHGELGNIVEPIASGIADIVASQHPKLQVRYHQRWYNPDLDAVEGTFPFAWPWSSSEEMIAVAVKNPGVRMHVEDSHVFGRSSSLAFQAYIAFVDRVAPQNNAVAVVLNDRKNPGGLAYVQVTIDRLGHIRVDRYEYVIPEDAAISHAFKGGGLPYRMSGGPAGWLEDVLGFPGADAYFTASISNLGPYLSRVAERLSSELVADK